MKKITEINTATLGNIEVGVSQWNLVDEPTVKAIIFQSGACCAEDHYQESYKVIFENSTKTLEVFDVNYVIRDEE